MAKQYQTSACFDPRAGAGGPQEDRRKSPADSAAAVARARRPRFLIVCRMLISPGSLVAQEVSHEPAGRKSYDSRVGGVPRPYALAER